MDTDPKHEQGSDQKLTDQVPDTDSFRNFRTRKIGEFKIEKPGNYTLSVRVVDKPGLAVMDLRTITLKPPPAEKTEATKAETTKPEAARPDAGKTQDSKLDANKSATSKPADDWMTDLDRAKQVAAKEEKDLLINFTAISSCGACERLEREVLTTDEFAPAAKQFVLVRLDYPPASDYHGTLCGPIVDRLPQEPPPPHVSWRAAYHVDAFPTIFLTDATGRPYAVTGENGKGPTEYLEYVRQLREIHGARDAGFAAAAKLAGIERTKAVANPSRCFKAASPIRPIFTSPILWSGSIATRLPRSCGSTQTTLPVCTTTSQTCSRWKIGEPTRMPSTTNSRPSGTNEELTNQFDF